ncbi:hypothetical protein B0H12DRAFT_1074884 [Mycena haematopus]|nr:hypothetical protein B0H12DRAFT_1074884 [Mycena haematopus]
MKKFFGLDKPISLPVSQPIERSKNRTLSHHQVSTRPHTPSVHEMRDVVANDPPVLLPVTPQTILDSLDRRDPEPYTFHQKAKALYPCMIIARRWHALSYVLPDTADVPTEISLSPGEIFDIIDKQPADWWQARNANGLVGLAPSNYFQLL